VLAGAGFMGYVRNEIAARAVGERGSPPPRPIEPQRYDCIYGHWERAERKREAALMEGVFGARREAAPGPSVLLRYARGLR
jgi:hypothetical protein